MSPFGRPDAALIIGVCRAGGVGFLDLGQDARAALRAVESVARRVPDFGVRVHGAAAADSRLAPGSLPPAVRRVMLPVDADIEPWAGREIWMEVRTRAQAQAAAAAGADVLVAFGAECGGEVGTTGAFVLMQEVTAVTTAPVVVAGGIGLHTAAAAVAGGAAGVLVDDQLALARDATTPEPLRDILGRGLDGSETRVVGGHRILTRPGLPGAGVEAEATADEVRSRLGHAPDRDLVPLGQAAARARDLAGRFGTAAGILQALWRSIDEHLVAAREQAPLAPGAGVAGEVGTRYPVFQGPMTRVSDGAAFAEAVASAGGLPFLALSLMRGPRVRTLLEETSARLGDTPWGVGLLGFVPPELRKEQLDVLRDIRPPVALIAGGRPSQARALEQLGTKTWLHVPSPGLLEMFLADGARRFVFEGSECGGHIGPRTAFALWEAQIETLLAHASDAPPAELSLLFAGGVHDARSAAMVAALTAPLVAMGARVGVLMGTAYLFTEEAVAAGAILPGFQDEALACDDTEVLETSPGHMTRCAATPYVDAFRAEHQRLVGDGVTVRERWEALESMNLGRLEGAGASGRRAAPGRGARAAT